jgi:hypothetical protein
MDTTRKLVLGGTAIGGAYAYWRYSERRKFRALAEQSPAIQAFVAAGAMNLDELVAARVPLFGTTTAEQAWTETQKTLPPIPGPGQQFAMPQLFEAANYVARLLGAKQSS